MADERRKMIHDIADDISCGESFYKYDASYFLDSLMDSGRVTADDVAVLLTKSEHSDAHIYVADKLREMVKEDAIEFFSEGKGVAFIDDRIAEERAVAAEEAADARRDDSMTGDV